MLTQTQIPITLNDSKDHRGSHSNPDYSPCFLSILFQLTMEITFNQGKVLLQSLKFKAMFYKEKKMR